MRLNLSNAYGSKFWANLFWVTLVDPFWAKKVFQCSTMTVRLHLVEVFYWDRKNMIVKLYLVELIVRVNYINNVNKHLNMKHVCMFVNKAWLKNCSLKDMGINKAGLMCPAISSKMTCSKSAKSYFSLQVFLIVNRFAMKFNA